MSIGIVPDDEIRTRHACEVGVRKSEVGVVGDDPLVEMIMARRGGASTDFIEASVIDSRLRELLAQRRVLFDESAPRRGGAQPPAEPQWRPQG